MLVLHHALGFIDLISSVNSNTSRYLLAVLLYLERKRSSDFKELAKYQRQRKGRMRNERGLPDSKARAWSFYRPAWLRWHCSLHYFSKKTRACGLLEGGAKWAPPLWQAKTSLPLRAPKKRKLLRTLLPHPSYGRGAKSQISPERSFSSVNGNLLSFLL